MSRRILLVEDDAETADYILKGLREEGYTADHMVDGRDGFYAASGGSSTPSSWTAWCRAWMA